MERIRLLRKTQGWTQTELGKKIGVSQKVIADYETGNTKPPVDRLPILASSLKVTVDELLLGESSALPEAKKSVHGNSRVAKIQEIFTELPPLKQKQVLSHAKALLG